MCACTHAHAHTHRHTNYNTHFGGNKRVYSEYLIYQIVSYLRLEYQLLIVFYKPHSLEAKTRG